MTGLVASMSDNLRNESNIPVFTEQTDRSMLFGIPGVTREADQVNALMLGVNPAKPGTVLLKLQYIDPSQIDVHKPIAYYGVYQWLQNYPFTPELPSQSHGLGDRGHGDPSITLIR